MIYAIGLLLLIVSTGIFFMPLVKFAHGDVPYMAILWAAFYLSLYSVEAGFIGFYYGRDCSGGQCSWLVYLLAPIFFLSTVWTTGIGGFDEIPDAVIRNSFRVPDVVAAIGVAVIGFILGRVTGVSARQSFYALAFDHLLNSASNSYGIEKGELKQFSTISQVSDFIANKKEIDSKTISGAIIESMREFGAGFDEFDENTDLRSLSKAANNPDEYLNSEFLRIALDVAATKFGIGVEQLQEQKSIRDIATQIAKLKSIGKEVVEKALVTSISDELSLRETQIDSGKFLR